MRKLLLLVTLLSVPAITLAQGSGRAHSWDFSVSGIYQQGDSASGDGGSSLEIDDEVGLGFNIGYNWSDNLNFSANIDFLRPDYTAIVVSESNPPDGSMQTTRTDHRLSQFNGRFKGTHLLPHRWTFCTLCRGGSWLVIH